MKRHPDGVFLSLKVQPRASADAVAEAVGNELKIKVTAPPVDAAANEALLRLLAGVLECRRGDLQIVRGQTSRHKVVFARGVSLERASARLRP